MKIDTLSSRLYDEATIFWKSFRDSHTHFFLRQKESIENTGERGIYSFCLNDKARYEIFNLVGTDRVGIFVCLLSAMGLVIKMYSDHQHITLKSPLLSVEKETDLFEIALPLSVPDKCLLKDYLNATSDNVKKAYRYEERFRNEFVKNITSNILFSYAPVHVEQISKDYDLVLNIQEKEGQIFFNIEFKQSAFENYFIESFEKHINHVLKQFGKLSTPLDEIEILLPEEKKKILIDFNAKSRPLKNSSVIELIETWVLKAPKAVAVEFNNHCTTYEDLNLKVNSLARYLKNQFQLNRGDIVAVNMNRSDLLIIVLLGIFKLNLVYLPIDPEYPSERKKRILEDSGAKILLTDKSIEGEKIMFDNVVLIAETIFSFTSDPLFDTIYPQADDLAYIIYTSGTTGSPKGVLINHKGLLNLVENQIEQFEMSVKSRTLQFASISFDASLSEIFITLCAGGTLVMVGKEVIQDINKFPSFLNSHKITVITLPPAYLDLLDIYEFEYLRVLITAGEKANATKANEYGRNFKYFNAYGPTENSIGCIWCKIDPAWKDRINVPIGKPIINTEAYILNSMLHPVPIGVSGELYVGGIGLARGYKNLFTLTAEKFIENPFRSGSKLYRTGDTCRWLDDGNIEFIGRIDEQLKIRGYRIEPSEIENILCRFPGIDSAAVITKETEKNDKRLIAFFVTKGKMSLLQLKKFLRDQLPEFMIPGYFVSLDKLPVTFNGKIDKQKLIERENFSFISEENFAIPRNDIEKRLTRIWESVLDRRDIGIFDNFFEIGGHSLMILKVLSRINTEFSIQIPIDVVFNYKTIAELGECIYGINSGKDSNENTEFTTFTI